MLRLSSAQLDHALSAVLLHGYGDFFPQPPELSLLVDNWKTFRDELAKVDLDLYEGQDVIFSFAPKSRLNVRRVALLHPYDLVFYTALVLALRDGICASRSSVRDKRVFSYHSEGAGDGILYNDNPGYREFRDAISRRVRKNKDCYVGITDIADFYPRIYQHRLVNALQAACGAPLRDHIRVLEKMLTRFSENVSYGIPVGPAASRPLGEAILIDVDCTLLSFDIEFMRFTDDYVIFADTPEDAEYGIRMLGETLFMNHGLTLQTAKTKVLDGVDYVEQYLMTHAKKETEQRKLLDLVGDYDEAISYEDMTPEQKREVDAMNLSKMLENALAKDEIVDFREVSFILGRLSSLEKPELIPIVLDNLDRLAPVAHSISAFFRKFSDMDRATRKNAATALLDPILKGSRYASEYYSVWILSIFAENPVWDHAESLLKILRETRSDVVRRFAALALSASGTRAQVIQIKQYFSSASSLCRTALMLASKQMGNDERKYLKQSLRLHDSFEKFCIST
ncbi:MAG TPA: RNA-directed DNA polymerase [Candidatus Sulfotelmatobacter sp.]|nr:RNA-directed DNA polymerase [Candidatus Sulfotelmatobacter sp.]